MMNRDAGTKKIGEQTIEWSIFRMISPMTGLRNLVEEIMMADMMMRMITGRRTTGINNARKLWR